MHDVGADADALRVVGGVEDAAGRLWGSAMVAHTFLETAHLHQVQYSCPWDRHRCAMDVALGGLAELVHSRTWLGTPLKLRTAERCHA